MHEREECAAGEGERSPGVELICVTYNSVQRDQGTFQVGANVNRGTGEDERGRGRDQSVWPATAVRLYNTTKLRTYVSIHHT